MKQNRTFFYKRKFLKMKNEVIARSKYYRLQERTIRDILWQNKILLNHCLRIFPIFDKNLSEVKKITDKHRTLRNKIMKDHGVYL